MAKAGRNKVHSISILIQWCEVDGGQADDSHYSPQPTVVTQSQQRPEAGVRCAERHDPTRRPAPRTTSRLLPTDRLVLGALLDRIPQGETLTPPIRLRELMEECSISRRQVQICLRRLGERGMISRLTEGVPLGNRDGYRYSVTQKGKRLPIVNRE